MSAATNKASTASSTANAPTTQQSNLRPSLAGAKSKQRKGVAKLQAKFEPGPFRDQVVKSLESVPAHDFDGYYQKLDQVSNQLDFRKYDTQLFEILVLGGLLAPGGTFVDDGAPKSPFSILAAKEPVQVDDIRKRVGVFNKLMRKLKFLQKTFEDTTLKSIISYRWDKISEEKLAIAAALFVHAGLCGASVLTGLQKDHLVKDGTSVQFMTLYLRTYLAEPNTTDSNLSSSLRAAKMLNLELLWPITKRSSSAVVTHFTEAGLPRVTEVYKKYQIDKAKEEVRSGLKGMVENEDSTEAIVAYLQERRVEDAGIIPEPDYVYLIWNSLMTGLDPNLRTDLVRSAVEKLVREVSPVLEPFCTGAKTELALIYGIQDWCYDNTKVLPVFGAILEVLYDQDVLSAGAIQYWYTKGKAAQGRQQFLKFTEPLIKRLDAEEEEEDDE